MAVPKKKTRCTNSTEIRNNASRHVCLLRDAKTKLTIHGDHLHVWNIILCSGVIAVTFSYTGSRYVLKFTIAMCN
jgi:hypothetical protein